MSDMNGLKEMFESIKNEQAKQQEGQRKEAMDELVGAYRRMWREMRAGLLEEGVPEDLADEATLSFIRMTANNG